MSDGEASPLPGTCPQCNLINCESLEVLLRCQPRCCSRARCCIATPHHYSPSGDDSLLLYPILVEPMAIDMIIMNTRDKLFAHTAYPSSKFSSVKKGIVDTLCRTNYILAPRQYTGSGRKNSQATAYGQNPQYKRPEALPESGSLNTKSAATSPPSCRPRSGTVPLAASAATHPQPQSARCATPHRAVRPKSKAHLLQQPRRRPSSWLSSRRPWRTHPVRLSSYHISRTIRCGGSATSAASKTP